jgi:TatA/E family protein of Tat protein translocase
MGTMSAIHWIIVAVVVLALFGPKTLSRFGKTAGRGVRAVSDVKKDLTELPQKALGDITGIGRDRNG